MGLSVIMCYIESRRDTLTCYMFLLVSLCVKVNLLDNMKYGIALPMRTQHGAASRRTTQRAMETNVIEDPQLSR